VEQYPLGGYSYDFYIPQYNLLIEADGVFFHPLKKSECKYEWQEKNMERANRKNILAKDMGYNLIRIREDEVPDNIALHISSHLMEIV
jgi:very-short-patch-repair endonuclease